MTPAEKLAKSAIRHRKPRWGAGKPRNRPFTCSIREVRESLRLTLHEVAASLQMSMAGLSEIERGTDPQLTTADKLARFYGKTIDELWKRNT